MKKHFATLALVLFAFFLLGCIAKEAPTATPVPLTRACFENGSCVSLEVVDTPEERAVGLMNRSFLANNSGMLFVFEQSAPHAFWMKNTLIPLDILWLEKSLNASAQEYGIVDVQTMLPCKSEPCTIYAPNASAKYALEVNAGFAAQNGLSVGGQASIELGN